MVNKLSRTQRKQRDEAIRQTASNMPELTLQELADMFNLKSRAHAHWILHKNSKQKQEA